MTQYLGLLNLYDPGWGPGMDYTPPNNFIITVWGVTYTVTTNPPQLGVITYDANPLVRVNPQVINVFVVTAITVTLLIGLTQASLSRGLA